MSATEKLNTNLFDEWIENIPSTERKVYERRLLYWMSPSYSKQKPKLLFDSAVKR